jgi:hypothetical protein
MSEISFSPLITKKVKKKGLSKHLMCVINSLITRKLNIFVLIRSRLRSNTIKVVDLAHYLYETLSSAEMPLLCFGSHLTNCFF